jgi:signal transduction histidine kinase
MRERVEAVGATLSVKSEIGRGTEVKAVWSGVQNRAKDG